MLRSPQEVGDRQSQVRIIGPSSPADCFKREPTRPTLSPPLPPTRARLLATHSRAWNARIRFVECGRATKHPMPGSGDVDTALISSSVSF